MDLLLTPLVTRLLKQYVKRSSEGAGRDLKVGAAARRLRCSSGARMRARWFAPTPRARRHGRASWPCPHLEIHHGLTLPCFWRLPRTPQVSFSRGNVLTLHNLELDLAPLLGGAAALAHVRRAFARRLSIVIPWTALTTQPIQVAQAPGGQRAPARAVAVQAARVPPGRGMQGRVACASSPCAGLFSHGFDILIGSPTRLTSCNPRQVVLDTVELVLSAAGQAPAPTPSASAATLSEAGSRHSLASVAEEDAAAGGGGSGSSIGAGWFGSTLQSMALRAGLNVTGSCSLQPAACPTVSWTESICLRHNGVTPSADAAKRSVIVATFTLGGPPHLHPPTHRNRSQADQRGGQVGGGAPLCGSRHLPGAAAAEQHGRLGSGAAGGSLVWVVCGLCLVGGFVGWWGGVGWGWAAAGSIQGQESVAWWWWWWVVCVGCVGGVGWGGGYWGQPCTCRHTAGPQQAGQARLVALQRSQRLLWTGVGSAPGACCQSARFAFEPR